MNGETFRLGRAICSPAGDPCRNMAIRSEGVNGNTDARHSLSRDFPETFPPGHIRSSVSPFGTDDPASLMSGAPDRRTDVNRFDGNPPGADGPIRSPGTSNSVVARLAGESRK